MSVTCRRDSASAVRDSHARFDATRSILPLERNRPMAAPPGSRRAAHPPVRSYPGARDVKRNDKRSDENKRSSSRDMRPGRAPGAEGGDGTGDPGATEELDQVVSMLGEIDIDVETVAEEAAIPEGKRGRRRSKPSGPPKSPPRRKRRLSARRARPPIRSGCTSRRWAASPCSPARTRSSSPRDRDGRARGAQGGLLARPAAAVRLQPRRPPARR